MGRPTWLERRPTSLKCLVFINLTTIKYNKVDLMGHDWRLKHIFKRTHIYESLSKRARRESHC